eukprot:TRINITY_DN81722_c0_g1_i1.p1 TRINITY_DN81722_c0_g1~~TRINITY_DN81722_c0_g1_i1.p1  ORF type:complete len:129 (+),score=11.39 TRINITY_DN81722_c0_g1_i1:192-578(+)
MPQKRLSVLCSFVIVCSSASLPLGHQTKRKILPSIPIQPTNESSPNEFAKVRAFGSGKLQQIRLEGSGATSEANAEVESVTKVCFHCPFRCSTGTEVELYRAQLFAELLDDCTQAPALQLFRMQNKNP